uniref:Uncharacterized protein n=1 Tax=Anguilla anguilla TaxID=7936 RepID=A0A0E9UW38_ANGAN
MKINHKYANVYIFKSFIQVCKFVLVRGSAISFQDRENQRLHKN